MIAETGAFTGKITSRAEKIGQVEMADDGAELAPPRSPQSPQPGEKPRLVKGGIEE